MNTRLASALALLPVLAGCATVMSPAASSAPASALDALVARAPFKMTAVPLPSFPDRTFPITDFGAVGDGRTVATAAIAKAIAACAAAGGGHVVIPAGLWLTGPIELRSNVDLHSERGALVQFTPDHTAYPMVEHGDRGYYAESALTGVGLRNVAVTGDGIFDGAGDTWRPARKAKSTPAQWQAFLARGGVVSADGADWWPTKEAMAGEDYLIRLGRETSHPTQEQLLPGRDFKRSPLLFLDRCEQVLIDGVTLRNSPSGVLEPTRCANLTVRSVTIFNEWWAQNGDGMDINNCQNVLVYRCTVSAGDDGICMKANGTQRPGEDAALRNVIVAECTVYHGHGGFVVGGATDAGMRNLWATACDFVGTDVGIRIKSGLGHGGLVHEVTVDHIYMQDIVNDAILFDTHYDNTPVSASTLKAPLSRDPGKTPEFRDFLIRDVYCLGAGTAISITGLPQHPIHQGRMENIAITARRGIHVTQAADIVLKNVVVTTPETPAMTSKATSNIQRLD